MKRHMTLVALGVMAIRLPAMAADPPMPSYDISAFCRGARYEHWCVDAQYTARSVASYNWLKTAPDVRAECIAVNRWGDYMTLPVVCILTNTTVRSWADGALQCHLSG
jgi:hypothetical protein